MEKVSFRQWFTIDNEQHRNAFIHLRKYGTWPHGFITKNMYMDSCWYILCLEEYVGWLEKQLAR